MLRGTLSYALSTHPILLLEVPMKFNSLAVAVLALVSGAPAMAACTETFNMGVMGSSALHSIGNGFHSPQHFEDCYNFTLSGPADSFGFTFGFDNAERRGIDLTSITLSNGSHTYSVGDVSSRFSFNDLLAGTYQFVVTGDVVRTERGSHGNGFHGGGMVGYEGAFGTSNVTVAAPVPEPSTYAMLALGLVAVGAVVRRRNPV
jgi:hypothetical protein